MVTAIPVAYRKGKRKLAGTAPPPPAMALTLVAATYDDSPAVTLQFDRAIDVSGMDVTALLLADGDLGFLYTGAGTPTMVDERTVQVELNGVEEDDDPGVFLTVASSSGIVAVDDGGTWSGVSELGLPFP